MCYPDTSFFFPDFRMPNTDTRVTVPNSSVGSTSLLSLLQRSSTTQESQTRRVSGSSLDLVSQTLCKEKRTPLAVVLELTT